MPISVSPNQVAPNSGDATSVQNTTAQGPIAGGIGPLTLVAPMPSILTPRNAFQAPAAPPSVATQFICWVNANPVWAGAGAVAVYFLLRGSKWRKA